MKRRRMIITASAALALATGALWVLSSPNSSTFTSHNIGDGHTAVQLIVPGDWEVGWEQTGYGHEEMVLGHRAAVGPFAWFSQYLHLPEGDSSNIFVDVTWGAYPRPNIDSEAQEIQRFPASMVRHTGGPNPVPSHIVLTRSACKIGRVLQADGFLPWPPILGGGTYVRHASIYPSRDQQPPQYAEYQITVNCEVSGSRKDAGFKVMNDIVSHLRLVETDPRAALLRQSASVAGVHHEYKGNAPPPAANLGDSWINPRDGAELVYVPSGPFLMGECAAADNPIRTVDLDAFWVYKNLVTHRQYGKFCAATGHRLLDRNDDFPAELGWTAAAAYARWAGTRLPSEAEWEKAARGTDGRLYPWGNVYDDYKLWQAHHSRRISDGTTRVGSFPGGASWCGALDMVGNGSQWCADWYDAHYPTIAPAKNPKGPASGSERVVRGSQWWNGMHAPNRIECFGRNANFSSRAETDPAVFRCVVGH